MMGFMELTPVLKGWTNNAYGYPCDMSKAERAPYDIVLPRVTDSMCWSSPKAALDVVVDSINTQLTRNERRAA